jgi:hypothetical protein
MKYCWSSGRLASGTGGGASARLRSNAVGATCVNPSVDLALLGSSAGYLPSGRSYPECRRSLPMSSFLRALRDEERFGRAGLGGLVAARRLTSNRRPFMPPIIILAGRGVAADSRTICIEPCEAVAFMSVDWPWPFLTGWPLLTVLFARRLRVLRLPALGLFPGSFLVETLGSDPSSAFFMSCGMPRHAPCLALPQVPFPLNSLPFAAWPRARRSFNICVELVLKLRNRSSRADGPLSSARFAAPLPRRLSLPSSMLRERARSVWRGARPTVDRPPPQASPSDRRRARGHAPRRHADAQHDGRSSEASR